MTPEVEALYLQAGIEKKSCRLCDREMWAEFEYQKMGVCNACAMSVAHHLVVAHGGEPDPRFSPPEAFEDKPETRPGKAKISSSIRRTVFERDAYRCKKCGDHLDLQVDHIYPESKGGPTSLDNLQTLCRPCNIKKGAKIEEAQI